MTKIIKGDLILEKDTEYSESIKVFGNIKGDYNLKVIGNINAMDINAMDINAWNINARDINAADINAMDIDAMDIDAWNIDAWNINAMDIDALDIICEKRIKKKEKSKTICRIFIKNRSKNERKDRSKEI